jgi:hypothetical protein
MKDSKRLEKHFQELLEGIDAGIDARQPDSRIQTAIGLTIAGALCEGVLQIVLLREELEEQRRFGVASSTAKPQKDG